MTQRSVADTVDSVVMSAELAVIGASLTVILVAVAGNVLTRTFNLRWHDMSDIALVAMSLLTFIGSAYAVAARAHITIDLGDAFPATAAMQRWAPCVSDVAVVVTSGLIVVFAGDFLAYVIKIDERVSGMNIPMWIPVGSLWLGSLLSVFHVICRLWRRSGSRDATNFMRRAA